MSEELKNKWKELSTVEKTILGYPNFACGSVAKRMREMGFECETKAESEQALVIFTMLEFHKSDPDNWMDNMNNFLKH